MVKIECGVCGRTVQRRRAKPDKLDLLALTVPTHVMPRTGRQCRGSKQPVRVSGQRILGLLPQSSSVREVFHRYGGLRKKWNSGMKNEGKQPERAGGWFLTTTGRKWYPLDPDPRAVDIEDIAWGLARLPRWAGHIDAAFPFYAVGQHSVDVSITVERHIKEPDKSLAMAALFHDVAEMYTGCGDVASPNKSRVYINVARNESEPRLITLRELELAITKVVFQALGIDWPTEAGWKKIKEADTLCLLAEARTFRVSLPEEWTRRVGEGYSALPFKLYPAGPRSARDLFMLRYDFLKGS